MKILFSTLLLVAGLSLILGRSAYWDPYRFQSQNIWNGYNYDYDFLGNFKNSDINENLPESTKPFFVPAAPDNDNDDELDDVLSSMLRTLTDDDVGEKKDISVNNIVPKQQVDSDDSDEESERKDAKENSLFSNMLLIPFASFEEEKSSEEKVDKSDEEKNEISGENVLIAKIGERSNSNDVIMPKNVKELDLTRSSEEEKENIFDQNIDELVRLVVTLNILDEIKQQENKSPQSSKDDELSAKEADDFLNSLNFIIDGLLRPGQRTKEHKENSKEYEILTPKDDSKEEFDNRQKEEESPNDDENINAVFVKDIALAVPQYSSEENSKENDETTTAKNESDEENNKSIEDDNNDNEAISLVFKSIEDVKKSPNDYKYEIVKATKAFVPTNAPYASEIDTLISHSATNSESGPNFIQEYIELRQTLDDQQNDLQSNKLNLDKDFYTAISSDYNNDSVNLFDKDLRGVHANVDRIKRNINAMQNLSSKLYFYKMIKSAINDAQNKPKEEEEEDLSKIVSLISK